MRRISIETMRLESHEAEHEELVEVSYNYGASCLESCHRYNTTQALFKALERIDVLEVRLRALEALIP